MKKLWVYLKEYKTESILAPLFKLLEVVFDLLVPVVVAKIIDIGIANNDHGYIVKMFLVLILMAAVGLSCSFTAQYFAARASVGCATNLRQAVFDHIQGFSFTELDTIGTDTLITRMTDDINQVQNGVNLTLRLLLRSPFVVFGAMVMAFTIDTQAALVFAGVIPILCIVVFGIMLITMPMYKRVQQRLDGVTGNARQNLSGVRVLRAFNMEKSQIQGFDDSATALTASQMAAGWVSGLLNPLTFVIVNLAVIVLIRVGAVKVDGGVLTQGLVIALYNYMSQILVELIKMANLIINITKAVACGNRVEALLEVRPGQKNGEKTDAIQGGVTFENVAAGYPGAAAHSLEGVSFTAKPGQTVGIIGGTGSGKTTLVNLIPRFYDAQEGTVTIDGTDVKELDQETLRSAIGVVPQKAVLFHGTIRENLRWGKEDATDEELWDALDVAQAREVVKGKEGELDAPVEQGGTNFSGGQKQRLTIARALVRKPRILILDDSASALDYATDARLRMAIRNMKNPPTTFIVSQRSSAVRYADEILVLDDGKLVGKGTHEELLKNCPVYREIVRSQFPEEVKDNG